MAGNFLMGNNAHEISMISSVVISTDLKVLSNWKPCPNTGESHIQHPPKQFGKSRRKKKLVGGFQSIWKLCSFNWIISRNRHENKKYFKPPPRFSSMFLNVSFSNHPKTFLQTSVAVEFVIGNFVVARTGRFVKVGREVQFMLGSSVLTRGSSIVRPSLSGTDGTVVDCCWKKSGKAMNHAPLTYPQK